jgi:hypothetical protein
MVSDQKGVCFNLSSLFPVIFSFVLLFAFAGSLHAGHKPKETSCGACHSVSGVKDRVVIGTDRIKKDERIIEIQSNPDNLNKWKPGQDLPCAYCHQDNTHVRTNMIGVKDHFSGGSLYGHPVNELQSNSDDPATRDGLDCVDCHVSVGYVGTGLDPTIHGVDAAVYGMTEGNGALHFASTFRGIGATLLSPYNADGNTFCTNLCHDDETSGTQYTSGKKFHGYSQTTISLEGNDSQLTTTIPGCLSTDGSPTGCHMFTTS